ncbi:hypothetical protein [Microvirga antarctica]|uniref:hypothetical protein n=1 Tax=Microvirga antarctica TaxID=2819233 RepID=UPI001B3053B0
MLGWPWLSGAVTIPWDAKAHFYPQLQFLAQSIARGEWPFWNPFIFAGHPQIADPQSLIFSPPFLALAAIGPDPSFRAADATILGMLLLGATAILLLARDRKWHPAAALLAALVFCYGGSSSWRIQHIGQILSLSYWPIAWLLLSRALDRSSVTYGFFAGLVAGFMVLGRDQVAYLGVWFLVAIVLFRIALAPARLNALRRAVLPLSAGVVAGLLVAAGPLILTILLNGDSNRFVIDQDGAGRGSLHPALLLTSVVPQLFGAAGPLSDHWGPPSPAWGPVDLYLARNMGQVYLGALPMAALFALAWGRGLFSRADIRGIAIATLAVVVYTLGRYTPLLGIAFDLIPGFSLFRRPADATFLLTPLAGLCAAYLLHRWLTDQGDQPLLGPFARALFGFAFLFLVAAAVANSKDRLDYALWPLAQAGVFATGAVLVLFAARPLARGSAFAAACLIVGFMVLDLGWNNGPSESTALPPALYNVLKSDGQDPTIAFLKERVARDASSDRRDRIELVGIDFHWPNASMTHRLEQTLGYNPVRLRWYSEATGAGDHVALPSQRQFSPLFPSYTSRLSDLLGLRYIASRVPIAEVDRHLAPGALPLIGQTDAALIYENPGALPRVMFATQWQRADFARMIESGIWPATENDVVLLETDPPARVPVGAAGGEVRIAAYGNSEVVVDVNSPSGGFVLLNDVWHPWWFASLDGQSTPLLRANVIFRAVQVPAGRHRVTLTFRPVAGAIAQIRQRLKPVITPAPS